MILLKLRRYFWRIHPRAPLGGWILEKMLKRCDVFYGIFLYDYIPKRNSIFVTCYEYSGLYISPAVAFWELTVPDWQGLGGFPIQGFIIERARTAQSKASSKDRSPGHVDQFCERFELIPLTERWFQRN